MFNTVLVEAGCALNEVRLLRHQERRTDGRRTPYELWRDDRAGFELYQSHQSIDRRAEFMNSKGRTRWASFVAMPNKSTLFVGLYDVGGRKVLEKDTPRPHMAGFDPAGSCDVYDLQLSDALRDLIGKLIIEWGDGYRSWVQRADRQNKAIQEIRPEFKEPEFPGFLNFIKPLSELESLPESWIAILKASGGVYLLTCPRTKEQYVGSASSTEDGFWCRWQTYIQNGHGGNVALKSREPSDYQVSILEVAGSSQSREDILAMETRWKRKLQSQEMGLNRN